MNATNKALVSYYPKSAKNIKQTFRILIIANREKKRKFERKSTELLYFFTIF